MWLYGDTECRLLQIIQMGHLACLAACHNKIETDFHHKQLSIQYEVLILTDHPNGTPIEPQQKWNWISSQNWNQSNIETEVLIFTDYPNGTPDTPKNSFKLKSIWYWDLNKTYRPSDESELSQITKQDTWVSSYHNKKPNISNQNWNWSNTEKKLISVTVHR